MMTQKRVANERSKLGTRSNSEAEIGRPRGTSQSSFGIDTDAAQSSALSVSTAAPEPASMDQQHKPMKYSRSRVISCLSSIRLCTVVVMMCLVLIPVLLVALLWCLGFWFLASDMVSSMRRNTYVNTYNTMIDGNRKVNIISKTAAVGIQTNLVNITEMEDIRSYLWRIWKANSQDEFFTINGITGVFAGLADGGVLGFSMPYDTGVYYTQNWGSINPTTITYTRVIDEETGALDSAPETIIHNHSLEQSKGVWYVAAAENAYDNPSRPKWSSSYVDPGYPGSVFLSLTVSIVKDGEFHAFTTVDVTTKSLSNLLSNETNEVPGSVAFVIEKSSGYLICSSITGLDVFEETDDGGVLRHTVDTYGSRVVRTIGQSLKDKYGDDYSGLTGELADFNQAESVETSVMIDGTTYVVQIGMRFGFGLEWIIISATPLTYYLAMFFVIFGVATGMAISISIITMSIALMYSILIIRPFLSFSKSMVLVEDMRLDEVQKGSSFFTEVASLQQYFHLLVERMKVYRAFVPQHLLQTLDEQLDNDVAMESRANKTEMASKDQQETLSQRSETSASGRTSTSINTMRFEIGLDLLPSVMLLVRLENFFDLLSNVFFTKREVIELHGQVVEIVQRAALQHRGEVTSFGDMDITVVWSLQQQSRDIHRLAERAISATEQILDQVMLLNKRNQVSTTRREPTYSSGPDSGMTEGDPVLHAKVTATIASGDTYIGNLGTKTLRHRTVEGPVLERIKNIAKLHTICGTRIIVSDGVRQIVESAWVVRPILYPYRHHGALNNMKALDEESNQILNQEWLSRLMDKTDSVSAFELGPNKKVDMDEWMYELEQHKKLTVWDSYTDSVTILTAQGNIHQARRVMAEYLQDNPSDIVAQVAMNIMEIEPKRQFQQKHSTDLIDDDQPHTSTAVEKIAVEENDDERRVSSHAMMSYHHPDAASPIDFSKSVAVVDIANDGYAHPDMV